MAAASGLPVTATAFPITVGGGGAAFNTPNSNAGNSGSNSVFSTITSAGGGGGGSRQSPSSRAGVACLLYTSPSPRDRQKSRMPSSA